MASDENNHNSQTSIRQQLMQTCHAQLMQLRIDFDIIQHPWLALL